MDPANQTTDSEKYHHGNGNQEVHVKPSHNQNDQRVLTLNLLLLGEAQSGRSSVGNALIGGAEFQTGWSGISVTRECRLCCRAFQKFFRRRGEEADLRLRVMDTPPLPTGESDEGRAKDGGRAGWLEARRKISQSFREGVHFVVLVVRADVPLHNQYLIQTAQELFGASWSSHALLVLTHADKLEEAGLERKDYWAWASDSMRALIDAAGGQYFFLDNSSGWPEIAGRPLRKKLLQLSARNAHTPLAIN